MLYKYYFLNTKHINDVTRITSLQIVSNKRKWPAANLKPISKLKSHPVTPPLKLFSSCNGGNTTFDGGGEGFRGLSLTSTLTRMLDGTKSWYHKTKICNRLNWDLR